MCLSLFFTKMLVFFVQHTKQLQGKHNLEAKRAALQPCTK